MRVRDQIILFLEGMDKSGKTHLGKLLSSALSIPYYHGERAPATADELKTRTFDVARIELMQMYDVLRQTGISIIIDRWHLSEYVYSKVFGRSIDNSLLWHLDEQFAELGAIIIYCAAKDELIKSRFNEEEIVDFSDKDAILYYYNDAIAQTKCEWIPYTSEVTLPSNIAHDVISLSSKYRRLKTPKRSS